MTNAEIIFNHACKLAQDGIIGTTGRLIAYEMENGETAFMPEPEEIHTFKAWLDSGFAVKKGSHAVAAFKIWKPIPAKKKKVEDGQPDETEKKNVEASPDMIMTTAHFFAASQVEAVKA